MYLLFWQRLRLVEQGAHLGGGEGDHLLNHACGVGVPALERGHLVAHRGQLPVRERTHVLPVLLTLRCNEARSPSTTHSTHFTYSYMASDIWYKRPLRKAHTCWQFSTRFAATNHAVSQRHTQHISLIAIWHQIYGINDHSERHTHAGSSHASLQPSRQSVNDTLDTVYLWLYGIRYMV